MTIAIKSSIPAPVIGTEPASASGPRAKAKTPGKGKPTPKRQDSERARREAHRPPNEVLDGFARAIVNLAPIRERQAFNKRYLAVMKEYSVGDIPMPIFTRDEATRLKAGK